MSHDPRSRAPHGPEEPPPAEDATPDAEAAARLADFLHGLRTRSEAERLVTEALEALAGALAPRWITAWLVDELRPGLHRVAGLGLPAGAALPEVLPDALASAFPAHIDLDAPVGAGLAPLVLPVADLRGDGAEMGEVRRLEAQLLVTLPGAHLVQGALLVGPPAHQARWDEAALRLLEPVAVEVGRALGTASRSPGALLPGDGRLKTPAQLKARLEEELARAERFKRPLTVAWVAIDPPPGLTPAMAPGLSLPLGERDEEAAVIALCDAIGAWLGATLRVMDTLGKRPDRALVAVLPETDHAGGQQLRARLFTLAAEQAFGLTKAARARLRLRLGMASYPEDGVSSRFLLLAAERDAAEVPRGAAAALVSGEARHLEALPAAHGESAPVAASARMREVMELARRVAPSKLTVLVMGETGVGKERIAEFIRQHSDRHDQAEVRLNCGAIPETMIEAEFFGFERGSFTGAVRSTRGKFELADRGTLFLDEIGELSLAMQVKLLRVLDEQRFYRLGAATPSQVDVRVIAITNRDLAAEVQAGRFREDLFYRLNVVTVKIPPLRERPEDIPPLVERLIAEFCERSGLAPKKLALEAYDLLYTHPWRGNVRELRNVIERSVVVSRSAYITGEDIVRAVPDLSAARPGPARPALPSPRGPAPGARASAQRSREEGVLEVIRRRPDIGLQEILREVGTSKSTGIRLVNELIARGQVVRRERGKRSRYRLAD